MMTLEALRATLPVYPIELQKPDIRWWKTGTHGVDYVHTFDSGVPGPHVMINALTHGNELCGAIAVDALWPPVCVRHAGNSRCRLPMWRRTSASTSTIPTPRALSMRI